MWHRKQLALAVLVIVLVPLILALLNPRWLFAPAGLDSWMYLGFFRHFPEYQGQVFPETYYGSRLSWVLPGYCVHKYLPPITANYVLHLGVHLIAVLSLFEALRHTTSPRAALVTALLMAGHSPFLESVGWDYVDGVGTAYYLLTCALLVRAARSSFPRPWLFAAGVGAAAALYVNLVWLPLLCLLLPTYAMLHRRFNGRVLLANVDTQVVMMVLGAATLTAMLAMANRSAGGRLWFYRPSIDFALSMAGKDNPWTIPVAKWLPRAYWLVWPACAVFGSAVYLVRRQLHTVGSDALACAWWPLNFLLITLLFAVETARGQPFLQLSYYASYLLGPLMLACGSLLAVPLTRLPRPAFAAAVGFVAAAAVVCVSRHVRVPLAVPLCCTFVGIAGLTLQPLSRWTGGLCLALLIGSSALLPAPGVAHDEHWSRNKRPVDRRAFYSRVMTAAQYVDEIKFAYQKESGVARPKVWFWYDVTEPLKGQHASLAAVWLWGYSLINEQFPTWNHPSSNTLSPGDLVVVPSQRPDVVALALASTGGDQQFALRFLDSRFVGKGDLRITLAVFVLEARR